MDPLTVPVPVPTTAAGVAVVPLIVALVEVVKGAGLPTRWCALAAVLLGVAASAAYQAFGPAQARTWADALAVGLALGLSAAGLYSGARTTLGDGDGDSGGGVSPGGGPGSVRISVTGGAATGALPNAPARRPNGDLVRPSAAVGAGR